MDIEISKLLETVSNYMDEELFKKYRKGIKEHLKKYIQTLSPDDIIEKNGTWYVSEELQEIEYISKYLEKDNGKDFSAKDCAFLALERYNVPPQEYMSVDSLEKKIRELFKEYKNHVFIKRSRGKGNVFCVDRSTAEEILLHSDVRELIEKQINKAEHEHDDTVEWKTYEFAKEKIEYLDSLSMEDDYNGNYVSALTENKKINLMLEAVYNSLFSAFDFAKYEQYYDEMSTLNEEWDFGERYQELYDIFNSTNYKNQFYALNPQSEFLDVLAEKIAEKIIKKMEKKES
jgi:hypothetical protein